jgi:hypothetical protein
LRTAYQPFLPNAGGTAETKLTAAAGRNYWEFA